MPPEKRKRTVRVPQTIGSLSAEVDALKATVAALSMVVRKHKDILQVQDNWHSRVAKMIGKPVEVKLSGEDEWLTGTLLWTDRYNIGLHCRGEDELINKGHVKRLRLRG